jgi:hypothetical protein
MKHPVRWSLLSTVAITLAVAWLARAADSPAEFVAGPAAAPAASSGSLYPAPQVDASAPPAPPAPTF